MAQFNYNNGDVLAAFGNGTAPDVIVDLTQVNANNTLGNFQSHSYSMSQDLSGVLNDNFGSVNSSIYWAIFAVNDTAEPPYASGVSQTSSTTVWATLGRSDPSTQTSAPHVGGNSTAQTSMVGHILGLGNLTYPGTVNFAPGQEEINNQAGGAGFTYLNNNSAMGYNGNFGGSWTWNTLNNGAGTSDFYQSNPGNHNTQYATDLGAFGLSSGGVLTFDPVPEPSTWAMIGSGALALLALRRRK